MFYYRAIHDKHISAFLVQLLDRVGLNQSWKDTIEPLAIKVCQTVSHLFNLLFILSNVEVKTRNFDTRLARQPRRQIAIEKDWH
jgi:hypothetical protein